MVEVEELSHQMAAVVIHTMEAWSHGSMRLSMVPSFKRTRLSLQVSRTKGELYRNQLTSRTTSTFKQG
jgi:hypothetical protein